MNPVVYNASLGTGLALIGAGAWWQYGPGIAGLVVGGLVIALTFASAILGSR